jgi:ribose transport system ATP-binding protein
VDANARFDIYRAIRAKVERGLSCVVNSSDAMELAGICDRVLVFSRGTVIRELRGGEISEESIVAAFLRSKEVVATVEAGAVFGLRGMVQQLAAGGSPQWWVPLLFLLLLTLTTIVYATTQTDVFLTELNIRHILLSTAPLALVTMAQFNVLMVRGFDMSVGSLMSVTVVLASFLVGTEAEGSEIYFGVLLCLLAGAAVGSVNGALVQDQPVSDQIWDIPAVIAYCSTFIELKAGDVIATGTPGGVGDKRTPPLYLQPGDTVTVSIGVIGTLTNPVIAEAQG